MTNRKGSASNLIERVRVDIYDRMELGDAFLFLYFLVFVRQYLWFISNNSLAWTLSLPLTLVCWYWYLKTKPFRRPNFAWSFWLVVGLPLILFYVLRAAFPDLSFDVIGYHLLHSERSLRGPLYFESDFFPSHSPFNPAPDTLFGITRIIFGYRLGTILNLFVLIWCAQILDNILRLFISNAWLRALAVLSIVLVEHVLFEISTYMVDLLALPLLLQATFLTLHRDQEKNGRALLGHIALLLGMSASFKFTNLAVVIPLIIINGFKALKSDWTILKPPFKTVPLLFALFIAPLIPFAIYIYSLTGNPVFPIANVFFKSPYWPTHGGWDARWGPTGFGETIAWPVLVWFNPERHSELNLYAGRLSLGVIVAVISLIFSWRHAILRTSSLLLIAASLLWGAAGLGYSRYGLYQELLAGIVVVGLIALLLQAKRRQWWKVGLATLLAAAVVTQAVFAARYQLHNEWGGRTTLIKDPEAYLLNTKMLLRDRTLINFLSADDRSRLSEVSVWAEACPQSTGFEVLLKPDVPVIAVRQPEFFFTRESRKQFVQIVEGLPQGKMFSICFPGYLQSAKDAIAARGLEIGRVMSLEIPFFSNQQRIGMVLIEILRPEGEALQNFQSSWMNAAFPDYDYREEIEALDAPTLMNTGQKAIIRFKVRNLGDSTWPAIGNKEGRYQVNIANRWLTADGKVVLNGLEGRTAMPNDLAPRGEIELALEVTAPPNPGSYIIEIDMVHEGVTWFYERGARPLRLQVRVVP